ncbi:MAG: cell division protein ZapA [Mediterranea sp.]|jgi:cell division protein ZapA|nr:cell division protein ZapA [Mediterranea sp.]
MNDKIKINLQIAEANYPLTIDRNDEEMVRKAAKQVNIRLNTYRTHYPNLDLEKVIAMVAYEFSLETLKQKQRNDTAPYIEKIEELTGVLEDHFKSNTLQ